MIRKGASGHGAVFFEHTPLLELSAKFGHGRRGFGDQQQATRGAVEAMDGARQAQGVGFGGAVEIARKRALDCAGEVARDRDARRLAHHRDKRVFIQYIQRQLKGWRESVGLLEHFDVVSGLQFLVRCAIQTVDLDASAFHCFVRRLA